MSDRKRKPPVQATCHGSTYGPSHDHTRHPARALPGLVLKGIAIFAATTYVLVRNHVSSVQEAALEEAVSLRARVAAAAFARALQQDWQHRAYICPSRVPRRPATRVVAAVWYLRNVAPAALHGETCSCTATGLNTLLGDVSFVKQTSAKRFLMAHRVPVPGK